MKRMIFAFSIIFTPFLSFTASGAEVREIPKNAYAFSFESIDGKPLPLSKYRGKTIMIVNTASRCGFTKQYSALQVVWQRYKERGFVLLGVPSGDFGNQEFATEKKIKTFCEVNFNIDFPMTQKTSVTGKKAHEFYKWARTSLGNLAKPRWNFHKYLVDQNGELVDWFSSPTSPTSNKVIRAIEKHLPPAS